MQRINAEQKKLLCKQDDKSSHQNSIKFHIFIASKGVRLSLNIWRYKKPLDLLQNIYLMLELLYHNRNHLITTVVDGSICMSNHILAETKMRVLVNDTKHFA